MKRKLLQVEWIEQKKEKKKKDWVLASKKNETFHVQPPRLLLKSWISLFQRKNGPHMLDMQLAQ